MVTEHQEKSICGLLFLGKQAYQPASKASDFWSRIFINLASSSQFIQYFIFILCHNASFLSCWITSCCILKVILLECFLHIINLFLARFRDAYCMTNNIFQDIFAQFSLSRQETLLHSFINNRFNIGTIKSIRYLTDTIQGSIVQRLLLFLQMNRRTRQTLWSAVQMLTQKLCCQTIHDCPKVVPLHYESE